MNTYLENLVKKYKQLGSTKQLEEKWTNKGLDGPYKFRGRYSKYNYHWAKL